MTRVAVQSGSNLKNIFGETYYLLLRDLVKVSVTGFSEGL